MTVENNIILKEHNWENIDTILFDLDGTLINTIDLIIESFLYTMDIYYPGEYGREDVIPFIGPPLAETFAQLDMEKCDEMMNVYRTHNHNNHDALVCEYEGVNEAIELLYNKGFKLGIVTTKRRETAIKGLELMKLDKYFDVVITLDDVKVAKPDPEPLNRAMELLESVPEKTLMVGDSKHDILGGKNAGTLTAGVAWSIQGKDKLLSYEPDLMLENMKDLLSVLAVERA